MEQNKLTLPIAIIIAGALIAGAVIVSSKNKVAPIAQDNTAPEEIVISPITSADHILGNPDAPIVLVEFSDTECPFCQRFHDTMHKIVDTYGKDGKVAWVYRHFPIDQLHPKARKESEAIECAAEQGGNDMFWKYTDKVYSTTNSNNTLDIGIHNSPKDAPIDPDTKKPYYAQKTPRSNTDAGQLSDFAKSFGLDVASFENCLKSGKYTEKVEAQYQDGVKAGGQGTPYTVIVTKKGNTPIREGALPYENMKQIIDALLADLSK